MKNKKLLNNMQEKAIREVLYKRYGSGEFTPPLKRDSGPKFTVKTIYPKHMSFVRHYINRFLDLLGVK